MKGLILSGGHGTRLYPATKQVSKQLLPVYDKPMIYYPLSTLMLAGITDIALVSTPNDLDKYRDLLGSGDKFGLQISYFEQKEPLGLPHAFIICEEFLKDESVCFILGDNIFHGNMRINEIKENFKDGALIFGYPVKDPQRFGVLDFDANGQVSDILEKPVSPPSNFAVPGIYFYDSSVVVRTKKLKPSKRGELEITDLNKSYLRDKLLNLKLIGRGIAWFDTGTSRSLFDASNFIKSVEDVQSYKIGCIEEIAVRTDKITYDQFVDLVENIPPGDYKNYLLGIKSEFDDSEKLNKDIIDNIQI